MKKIMMMTTAVGLCLAAPAFAQTTTDPNAPPAATNAPADPQAPAKSKAPANAQEPAATNAPAAAQAPAASPNAPASAQAPAASPNAPASAQAPAASPNAPANAQAPAASKAPASAQTPAASTAPASAQTPAASSAPSTAQAPAASNQKQPPAAAQSQPAQRDKPAAKSGQNAPTAGASAQTAAAPLPQSTQVRISQTLFKQRIRPANVNFSVNVGIAVPSSVTLRPLPASVIQIAPQYRGHRFFATQDRIVIVEPRRKTVIAVIDAGSGARVAAPAASKTSVSFTEQQRTIIRKQAAAARASTTGSSSSSTTRFRVQEQIPETVELLEFSEEVVREVPTVKSYRYYRQDNDLLLIDPGERRVIEIIR